MDAKYKGFTVCPVADASTELEMTQQLAPIQEFDVRVTITCQSDESYPTGRIQWIRDVIIIDDNDEVYNVKTRQIDGDYNGVYIVSRLQFIAKKRMLGTTFFCAMFHQKPNLFSPRTTLQEYVEGMYSILRINHEICCHILTVMLQWCIHVC